MKEKEALEDLKKLADCNVINSTMFDINHGESIELGIKALEKQIPYTIKKEGFNSCVGYHLGWCMCGNYVRSINDYCPDCGQKLDWN